MAKPEPEKVDPADLIDLAEKTISSAKFPQLATVDREGQPRLRPVSPVRRDGFTVYVANLRSYGKTEEIAANPKVELCYLDGDHNQVRITGVAEEIGDRGVLDGIWNSNPLLRNYLGTPDNPELIVYRVVPTRVRYMKEWALEYYEVGLGEVGGEEVQ